MSRVTDAGSGPGGSPTLDEVARLAGVSRATASRAINGHNKVSQKARDAVDAAVRTLGYAPNPAALTQLGVPDRCALWILTWLPRSRSPKRATKPARPCRRPTAGNRGG